MRALSNAQGSGKYTKLLVAIVLVVTFMSFYPCLRGGFVNFDDDRYVYRNPMIRDLSWQSIGTIFASTDYAVIYCPLVFLSYAIEYHFFELRPYGYHVTNLILHLCNCLLVFWFISLLCRDRPTAFITALLFGVHPLRVESVAWITERKDVLYAFFFLGALVCYCDRRARGSPIGYAGIVLLFLLALLSKPAALVLPFVLLLCDYFRGERIDRKNLLSKLPLFAVAFAFLVLGLSTARGYGSTGPAFSMFNQMFIPPYALLFYLYKSIAPLGLSCLYPFPVRHGAFLPAKFLLSPFILLILVVLVARSIRYTKTVAFGSLFFLVTILPALQLLPTGTAIVADRFTYIPSIGLSFLVARLVAWLYTKRDKYGAYLATAVLVAFLAVMAVLTWKRCDVWSSNMALWDDAVRKYPDGYVPLAYFNRGIVCSDVGLHEQAVSDFNRVLTIYYRERGMDRDYNEHCRMLLATGGPVEVYEFIASRYAEIGKTQEAIGCLNLSRLLRDRQGAPFGLESRIRNSESRR
jgi:hypothetical protein